ncbi:MAG: NADH-ubiquinone oxidoreductase subunit NDUFA12 family protein [Alphaproteobacteria bacterium]|nr:NADH-ubiquinone oxidoreductase subunit NDUFA12 family protein [Alphaproteobacteria bacterium]
MNIGIYLLTWFRGRWIGQDEFGNRYYQTKNPKSGCAIKRWVLYSGKAEASKIPAGWRGWLHYTASEPPSGERRYDWQQKHLPNLTGTPLAHDPNKGSPIKQNYESWNPDSLENTKFQ